MPGVDHGVVGVCHHHVPRLHPTGTVHLTVLEAGLLLLDVVVVRSHLAVAVLAVVTSVVVTTT